jgi:HlyD family secretion protein
VFCNRSSFINSQASFGSSESREAAEYLSPGREPWVRRPSPRLRHPSPARVGEGKGERAALRQAQGAERSRSVILISSFGADAVHCQLCGKALRLSGQQAAKPRQPIAGVVTSTGIALVVISLLACGGKEAPEANPTVSVQVATVARAKLQRKVTAEAVLYPFDQAAIVPKISAPVQKFLVNRGDRVHRGELLAVLEHGDLSASLTENKGAYDEAQANYTITTSATVPQDVQKAELDLKAAQDQLNQAQYIYDSRQKLFAQGALAKKDLDQASLTLVQARNQFEEAKKHFDQLQSVGQAQQVKAADGQLSAAKGKYEGAQAQLGYAEIRSPIDGVVTDRPLYAGEMASPGTPLITVMDISTVIARAHIPQSQAHLLKVGDPATLTVPGASDPIAGKVTVVSPALDPGSTTVEVWVQAVNPGGRLKPGTSVRLSVVAETVENAIVVPAAAIITGSDGSTSVMVVDSGARPHKKSAKVGINDGNNVQVTDGLQVGEKVVTIGAFELAKEDPDVLAKTTVQVQALKSPDKSD